MPHAAEIVRGYDTGVTLRQLFYRLVADGTLPNTRKAYLALSGHTTTARRGVTRSGTRDLHAGFPRLIDRGRIVHRHLTFDGPVDARQWLAGFYRRDRTEGQETVIYLGVEKAGIVEQLRSWFDPLGLPIMSLGGYGSVSLEDDVNEALAEDGRPSVLIYAGDFDASGVDIDRDFAAKTSFLKVERIALTAQQVEEYDLPEFPGKPTDTRAAGFVARHGKLVQVEVDALPPDVLRALYQAAIDRYTDAAVAARVIARENEDRARLTGDEGDKR